MRVASARRDTPARGPARGGPWTGILLAAGAALVLLAFAFRVRYGMVRFFEPDEFESLHSAWLLLQGQAPYRDFPALHPYPFWCLLLPIVALLRDNPAAALLAARGLATAFAGGVLFLTWRLGRRLFGSLTGVLAVVALCFLIMFLDESTQVRGSLPATLCWLWSLELLFVDLDRPGRGRALGAGLLLGAGFALYQSPFPLLAATAICLWHALATRSGGRLRARLVGLGGGFLAVLGLALLPLLLWGALADCWRYAVAWHLQWFRLPITGYFMESFLRENTLFWVMGLGGLLAWFASASRRDPLRPGLALAAVVLGLIFAVLPKPLPHHFLPMLPLLALAAASLVVGLARAALERGRARWAVAVAACLLTLTGLYEPATEVLARRTVTCAHDLEVERYVHAVTVPGTPVLDGAGMALFRPGATWLWFLPPCGVEVYEAMAQIPGDLVERQVPVVVVDTHMLRVLQGKVGATVPMAGWNLRTGLGPDEAARLESWRLQLIDFLRTRYVRGAVQNVLVAGHRFPDAAAGGPFYLVAPGRFRATTADPATARALRIDGRAPVGGEWELPAGWHTLECAGGRGETTIGYAAPAGR